MAVADLPASIAPGEWNWLQRWLEGGGNPGGAGNSYGFVGGTNSGLDWANFFLGDVPILGDALGLVSQQRAQKQAQKAQDAANRANEARFQGMLNLNTQQQGLGQQQLNETGEQLARQRRQMIGAVGQAGETARRDIMANQTAQMGAAVQDAQRRGLAGTSVLPNMRRAVASDTNRSLADLSERTGMARANVLGDNSLANFMQDRTRFETGLLGDRAGMLERRTDQNIMQGLLPLLMQGQRSGGSDSGGGLFGGILGGVGKLLSKI